VDIFCRSAVVDLFCGAGGLSLGFAAAGCASILAVENDAACVRTYRENFPGAFVFEGDIESIGAFRSFDALFGWAGGLVIGGPPCQGFSPLGKISASEGRRARHGSMNVLCMRFLDAVRELHPDAFVMENVPQFLRSEEFAVFRALAEKEGYSTACGVLNAEDFGVPQRRLRGFTVGILHGDASLPKPSGVRRNVGDVFADLSLDPDPTTDPLHFGRNPTVVSLERYRQIPQGGNRFDLMRKRPDICPRCWLEKPTGSTDVFGRLRWDSPALTVRTEFFKPEKGCYLHPVADRPITHREAARLQSFPDGFRFCGSKIEIARQIGNAVPPLLAFRVAVHVLRLIGQGASVEDWDPYPGDGGCGSAGRLSEVV